MSRAKYLWDSLAEDWVPAAQKKVQPVKRSNVVTLFGPVKARARGRFIWYRGDWVKAVAEPRRAKGLQVVSDISAYVSPVCDAEGKHPVIDGRAAQREDLKRNGCRVKEPSETLARAGVKPRPEPVVTDAMIRTAVDAYERAQSRN